MSGLPDFVVIGAMKAATSTLHMQLSLQPGISMSLPKEPNFFSDEANWARGFLWYRSLFAGADMGDICGESSTHYTKLPDYPDALPRLAAHLPHAKLIYMMRHPVDRLMSHYSHGWLERSIDGPIDAAIGMHPEMIAYGLYAMQIAPWIATFGKDRVLPVFMERMLVDPQAELERICDFLGYAGAPSWQADLGTENLSGERLRDSTWRDALVYHPLVTSIRLNLVPRGVRNWIKRGWQMKTRPLLGAEALTRVTALFDADLAELGAMLGVSLDCANFKQVVRGNLLDWV